MNVQLQNSFLQSLKRLAWHQSGFYRLYDLFRSGIPGFIKNVWKFRSELWSHNWWDYMFTLKIMKRSLEIQEQGMRLKGLEVSETLDKKVNKMQRVIELLQNKIDDNYIERTEKDFGELIMKDWKFEETNEGHYVLVDEDTEDEKKHNRMIFKKAHELENKEWKELWQIIEGKKYKEYKDYDGSDMRGWWD